MLTKSQFLKIIASDLAYEQNMVYAIDENGREHLMKNFADTLANKNKNSIKIERMEAYNSEIFSYCLELEDMYDHKSDWQDDEEDDYEEDEEDDDYY